MYETAKVRAPLVTHPHIICILGYCEIGEEHINNKPTIRHFILKEKKRRKKKEI